MQLAASIQPPLVAGPDGLAMSQWGQSDPARFYQVYESAFRERPGFPGWPRMRSAGGLPQIAAAPHGAA